MAMRVPPYGASSTPQVIGGPVNSTFMNDRYQPAIVTDASGRHAIWYEWVQIPSGGPGLLRTGKENLSLATATSAPVRSGETPLSTTPFPIYQTNPNQDPIIAACYRGDYSQIAFDGTPRSAPGATTATWSPPPTGATENPVDDFLQKFLTAAVAAS